MAPRAAYQTFADFQREEIRTNFKAGWSVDELEHSETELDFDMDPFEAAMQKGEADYEDD
jgi:hypothetical protein